MARTSSRTLSRAQRELATNRALVVTTALLVLFNVLNNEVLPSWAYVPTNLLEAGLLLLVARSAECTLAELGLDPKRVGSGLRWGLGAMAVIVGIYLVGIALPPARGWFEDDLAASASFGRMLFETVIRIPLGTVVLEEVAFRGVVLALAARRWGWRLGVVVSSALFGLWHVLPAAGVNSVNQGLADVAGGSLTTVLAAVVTTFIGGVVFCWLRRRSGSLLAPVLLHVATNSWGFFFAWLVD